MSREQDRGAIAAALADSRRSRAQGRLRAAQESLDRVMPLASPDDPNAARALADEGARLGLALEAKGSVLAALAEFARSLDLNPELSAARAGVSRGVAAYQRWVPPLGAVAQGNQLVAGATGAFWVSRSHRGRVVVLQGGINGETVTAARKALDVASAGVSWLLLDMKKLAYVGSTGLATTVKVAEGLESQGGGLALFSVASNLAIVINTLGLGRYLKVVGDLDGALALARGIDVSMPADEG